MSLHIHCVLILYQCPACRMYELLYKLIVTKNKFAASDEVISFRINDQSYSLIGFNQYAIKKMVDSYSYVCVLDHCYTCGRA